MCFKLKKNDFIDQYDHSSRSYSIFLISYHKIKNQFKEKPSNVVFIIFPPSSIVPKELLRKVRREGRIGAVRLESMLWGWGARRSLPKILFGWNKPKD